MVLSRLIVGGSIVLVFSLLTAICLILFFTIKNGWLPYPIHETWQAALGDYALRWIVLAFIPLQAAVVSILCSCITGEPTSALLLSWAFYGISAALYSVSLDIDNGELMNNFLSTLFPGFQSVPFCWTYFSAMPMLALSVVVFGILELLPPFLLACRRIKYSKK